MSNTRRWQEELHTESAHLQRWFYFELTLRKPVLNPFGQLQSIVKQTQVHFSHVEGVHNERTICSITMNDFAKDFRSES
jgi:hypothetical protein